MKKILFVIIAVFFIIPCTIILATGKKYSIEIENAVIYENNIDIKINIAEFQEQNNYKIKINYENNKVIEKDLNDSETKVNIQFDDEGIKNINIILYQDNIEKLNESKTIYYIEPYQNQFLEELSNKGVQVHFRKRGNYEDYTTSLNMLKKLGVSNIRAEIIYTSVIQLDGTYDFEYYDKWITEAKEKNINLILTLNQFNTVINDDEKLNMFNDFTKAVASRYPHIKYYEILNEPNMSTFRYSTDKDLLYYSKLVKNAREITNDNVKILAGVVGNPASNNTDDTKLPYKEFLDKITANNAYTYANAYSFHEYDGSTGRQQNSKMIAKLEEINDVYNNYGGFLKKYITEYGKSTFNSNTEEHQAKLLLQQTILMDKYGMDFSSIYNFCNTGTDNNNSENNYGLVRKDYTPKLSFYAMKNYYQNTNGAEYVGYLNLQDDLEAYVYNKDGQPLIITWSNNTGNSYDFKLNGLNAKDLYGKEINPDNDGNITITTEPIYLYNAEKSYFYRAISNVVTTKYDQFTEKFSEQISKVPGLETEITTLKQKIRDVQDSSNLDELKAIELMKLHYNIGNSILQAYKNKTLNIEYTNLSSMLDMLDDIGDFYEDLVTVSATTRKVDLNKTLESITKAKKLIENNEDLNIVIPSKILEFSEDYYENAKYINSVEEENNIKIGLITSNNLHSLLLANWSIELSNIYIDEYIKNNPVKITYSEDSLTNQNVVATLTSEANIQVTNNSNSKEYTFTENGTFKFEYTIKGQSFTKIATVTNIDKIAPTITGIENGKTYEEVTPVITDEHIDIITLTKNGQIQEEYKNGNTITEIGNYVLTVTDKATNKTQVTFSIGKLKSQVEIKYVEKSTNNELLESIIYTGQIGSTLDIKPYIKEINNYILIDKPQNTVITISENKQTIIFYYDVNSYNYTVEYYYDGKIDDTKTTRLSAKYNTIIYNYEEKDITGYKLEKTQNMPLTISSDEKANTIKIYYIKLQEIDKEVNIQNNNNHTNTNIIKIDDNDNTIFNGVLPKAGSNNIIVFIIVVCIVLSIVLKMKLKKYKDIK